MAGLYPYRWHGSHDSPMHRQDSGQITSCWVMAKVFTGLRSTKIFRSWDYWRGSGRLSPELQLPDRALLCLKKRLLLQAVPTHIATEFQP